MPEKMTNGNVFDNILRRRMKSQKEAAGSAGVSAGKSVQAGAMPAKPAGKSVQAGTGKKPAGKSVQVGTGKKPAGKSVQPGKKINPNKIKIETESRGYKSIRGPEGVTIKFEGQY